MLTKSDFRFVNAADTADGGFCRFGAAPAINDAGAVAFEALGASFVQGAVFRWQNGSLKTIATSADGKLTNFGVAVAINANGVVGFDASVGKGGERVIVTSDGTSARTIADSTQLGLAGGGFFGISGMNAAGTVVFLGTRKDFRSQAIFAGSGGPLTTVVDTATNPAFTGLANCAIDAAGRVVFRGFPADGSIGIFTAFNGITDVADTNKSGFRGLPGWGNQ